MVTCQDTQVARDIQLLDTARDCFYFVTKFFEPISVSATHIYHSALELCPISSIIRKLYYDRCHGVTRFPRVVIGNPDSWDTTVSVFGKHGYGSFTWSPCGQFIAALTGGTVEIRNRLTFELLTVFQSTQHTPLPTSPLVYSPDGRSLACGFSGGIVIWDIQTGGVAKDIKCDKGIASLSWSLDGKTIAITLNNGRFISDVETYDVLSGSRLFTNALEPGPKFHLWACRESFRLMVAIWCDSVDTLNLSISEIGSTLAVIESFNVPIPIGQEPSTNSQITFSPSTYHISISATSLHIFDIRTSDCLLREHGLCTSFQFSPDGTFFAAFQTAHLHVWKCTSGSYTSLWQFPFSPAGTSSLQFSPTSSSILSQQGRILHVRRLSDLPIASETNRQLTVISCTGRSIATTRESETIVKIIDLHSRTPPQFVDAGLYVERLAITDNILVVMGTQGAAGWLLTEAGMVDGVLDGRRAGRDDSKWTLSAMRGCDWDLKVEGKVGVIQAQNYVLAGRDDPLFYHTETGDVLNLVPEPQHSRPTSPDISTEGKLHRRLHCPTKSYDMTPLKTGGQFRITQRQRKHCHGS